MQTLRPNTKTTAGFTLIEAVIALAVAALAVLGFSSSLIGTVMLNQSNREATLARRAAHDVVADMQNASFAEVYARFNSDQGDNVGGAENLTAGFAVAGIPVLDGDADGLAGEIVFPDAWVGGALQLREDYAADTFGQTWDLNLDGEIDDEDHSNDYQVLPVLVRVEWRGRGGKSKIELRTTLIEM